MATQTRSRAAARLPLNRERVLRAAIALADAGGVETLSMRRLAQELGVEAMSLYNHVANKDDLLQGMVDIVVGEIELPSESAHWKTAMRQSAISAHTVLLRHRWAPQLLPSGGGMPGPARVRYMDGVLRCLRVGGFSMDLTDHAYHALESHINGFTLWQIGFPFKNREELVALGRTFLRQISADEHPYLAEHINQHLAPPSRKGQSEFDFGLDLLLDGLERMRTGAPA